MDVGSHNPYSAPASDFSSPAMAAMPNTGDIGAVVQSFRETKPWLRLISIAGFLGLALSLLGFLGVAVFDGGPALFSVVTLIFLVVYGIPIVQIHLYANAIDELVRTPDVAHLDVAVRRQRAFWRTVGILFLLGILLSVASVAITPFL